MTSASIKSITLYLIIFVLFTISCKDNEEQIDPVKDPESCLFEKQVIPAIATTEMVYNSKGLPVQIIQDDLSTAEPDRISMVEYDDRDNVIKISQTYGYLEYEYDANDKVISGQVFYRTDPSKSFTQRETFRYTYNNDGLMDSVIYLDSKEYYRYEYDSHGYMAKTFRREYQRPETLSWEYLKFDDKHIPLTAYFSHYILPAEIVITLISLKLPTPAPHNIETEKVLLAGGSIDTRNYTYTYNELDYPVTRTMSAARALSPAEKAGVNYVYVCK